MTNLIPPTPVLFRRHSIWSKGFPIFTVMFCSLFCTNGLKRNVQHPQKEIERIQIMSSRPCRCPHMSEPHISPLSDRRSSQITYSDLRKTTLLLSAFPFRYLRYATAGSLKEFQCRPPSVKSLCHGVTPPSRPSNYSLFYRIRWRRRSQANANQGRWKDK